MKQRTALSLLLCLATLSGGSQAASDNNVHMVGTLVAEPCMIPAGEEDIPLEFGTVIDKYLYENQRTKSEKFEIHLTECDPAIAKTVKVTFIGVESTALPGLLGLDAGSDAAGVAIGLETEDGNALPLNQATTATTLVAGENILRYRANVQGEPDALANRSIGRGEFTATATFNLAYE